MDKTNIDKSSKKPKIMVKNFNELYSEKVFLDKFKKLNVQYTIFN